MIRSNTAETTGDLIGNKTVDKMTKVPKTSSKNSSETNEEEILRERFISSEVRDKIIDDLKLRKENYWFFKINIIMEYQKIINLLDDITNQSSEFKTRNWVETNDELRGTYDDKNSEDENKNTKFITLMIRSRFCDYSDA